MEIKSWSSSSTAFDSSSLDLNDSSKKMILVYYIQLLSRVNTMGTFKFSVTNPAPLVGFQDLNEMNLQMNTVFLFLTKIISNAITTNYKTQIFVPRICTNS